MDKAMKQILGFLSCKMVPMTCLFVAEWPVIAFFPSQFLFLVSYLDQFSCFPGMGKMDE